ncbi:MAG: RluA family pseudouridine synthase [Calditrichales bacterium]|nr:MAG: RluA family pseudouridine synthase [Calditrichales bacterium]
MKSSQSGLRLDKYLNDTFSEFTRSHLQNLIEKGLVTVNGNTTKCGHKLHDGDRVAMIIPLPEPSKINPENIPINIVFEDESLLVINKPAGMVVHPGAGNWQGTLVNALLYHCKTLSGINGVLRPGIVHRLDKNTSGLMVVAKNDHSHVNLSRQFESKSIVRTYQAIVWGVPKETTGEIETNIGRNPRDRKKMAVLGQSGKNAITDYKILENFIYLSLLQLILKTGRTHQIRVHLNHIHHPVFGDPEYNGRKSQINRLPLQIQRRGMGLLKIIQRQALHAKTLSFIHPVSQQKVVFDSELPEDMAQVLIKIPDTLML